MKNKKLKIGVYGISGCAGCLLTFLYGSFEKINNLIDIKAFPLIKKDNYKGNFDYIFVEGTVCFDEDILVLNELRKKTKYIVALGSCACFGGVPSMKNFLDQDNVKNFVYPKHNFLKEADPTPIDKHIKVDYYLPQCPPNPEEITEFIKAIYIGNNFKPYKDPVCFECRKKANPCLLEKGELCLGPVTNGGCDALCPTKGVTCYGCRGPCKDMNIKAFAIMLREKGYDIEKIKEKMQIFAGIQFKEEIEKISKWLER